MSLKQATQTELKSLIDASGDYEGRYYLLYLYEHFLRSGRSEEELEPTAQHLIRLIKNINDLKNPSLSLKDQFDAAVQISDNYEALVKETGACGILYKATQVLLDLGGFIIGLCTAVFGAVVGSLTLGLDDIKNFRLPTGLLIGAFAGTLIGFMLGQRVPHGLFKEEETRLIRHSVNKLETTFESLYHSVEHDYVNEMKQEILTDYFSGNTEEFNKFLTEKQPFEILSVQASFFFEKLKGNVGHHSFIKFTINGDHENPKLIERGPSSIKETEFSQRELREATGEQIVKMLAMNNILHPIYTASLENVLRMRTPFQAGINDCHTYIDKILIAAGEPESQIERFTPEDSVMGHIIRHSIEFFKPVPEKLEHPVVAQEQKENSTDNKPM